LPGFLISKSSTSGGNGERTRLRINQMRCLRGRECKGKGRGHGIPCCVLTAAAAPPNPRNLFRRALYQLLDLKIYMHTALQTCLVVALRMVSHARDFNSFDFPPLPLMHCKKTSWSGWYSKRLGRRLSSDSSLPSNLTQKVAGASHNYSYKGGSLWNWQGTQQQLRCGGCSGVMGHGQLMIL
jgi:hypothetical protein